MFRRKIHIFTRSDPVSERQAQPLPALTAQNLSRCSTEEARTVLARDAALKLNALPLRLVHEGGKTVVVVASGRSDDAQFRSEFRFASGHEPRVLCSEETLVRDAIYAAYGRDSKPLEEASDTLRTFSAGLPEAPRIEATDVVTDSEVVAFLNRLIEYGIAQRASDVHILPRIEGTYVQMRIDGELRKHTAPVCSRLAHPQLVSRLKVLAALDTTQRYRPLDGSFRHDLNGAEHTIRVGTMPTLHGERVVLRLTSREPPLPLAALSLPNEVYEQFERIEQGGAGGILVCGPTGSGKTSTLYSFAAELAARGHQVCSIEDPIEREIAEISQSSVDERHALGFAEGIRALLRHDPDTILVGEIRDAASADAAVKSSLTGHLLLTSLHASCALSAVNRLEQFGIQRERLFDAFRVILVQQLACVLCDRCKVLDLQATHRFQFEVFRGVGCALCDYSGAAGRALLCEALILPALGHSNGRDISRDALPIGAKLVPMSRRLSELFKAGQIALTEYERFSLDGSGSAGRDEVAADRMFNERAAITGDDLGERPQN